MQQIISKGCVKIKELFSDLFKLKNAVTLKKNPLQKNGNSWGVGGSTNDPQECKLSPVRSIGDNDFLCVISWACWYYHPLLVLVNYLLCYVAMYICDPPRENSE